MQTFYVGSANPFASSPAPASTHRNLRALGRKVFELLLHAKPYLRKQVSDTMVVLIGHLCAGSASAPSVEDPYLRESQQY